MKQGKRQSDCYQGKITQKVVTKKEMTWDAPHIGVLQERVLLQFYQINC